ncbi:MAG: DUF3990 domain-containing protein [Bacteroidaceae bacterium]|nr:DUF3990 domain-containing protein [Bacteroidaceae bacterium]
MLLYHGSVMTVRKPAVARGRLKTDFGKGFYTTTSREQAEKWARIKKERAGAGARAVVSVFELDDALLEGTAYNIMRFSGATVEWLDFVVSNRRGEMAHSYDMIMGPVANDKLYATIALYEGGVLDAEAAILQLNTHTLFDQLSFHSVDACRLLTFVESFVL